MSYPHVLGHLVRHVALTCSEPSDKMSRTSCSTCCICTSSICTSGLDLITLALVLQLSHSDQVVLALWCSQSQKNYNLPLWQIMAKTTTNHFVECALFSLQSSNSSIFKLISVDAIFCSEIFRSSRSLIFRNLCVFNFEDFFNLECVMNLF